MMQPRLSWALVCLVLILSGHAGTAARGEVVLSKSAEPTSVISNELTALFADERQVLGAAAPSAVKRIASGEAGFFRARSGAAGAAPTPGGTITAGGTAQAAAGVAVATRAAVRSVLAPRAARTPNAPAPYGYTRASLRAMPEATGGEDWACLTEALYFEARGESIRGIFAVAEVILNRVDSARFPNDVCSVIRQGTGQKYRCQFSYTCDGRPENYTELRAKSLVGKIARIMLDGGPRQLTGGALFYHTDGVAPYWSRVFQRTTTIGYHHFYRRG